MVIIVDVLVLVTVDCVDALVVVVAVNVDKDVDLIVDVVDIVVNSKLVVARVVEVKV